MGPQSPLYHYYPSGNFLIFQRRGLTREGQQVLSNGYAEYISAPNAGWQGTDRGQISGKSRTSEKKFDFPSAWFIIVKTFLKEVIPGASARAFFPQEVLKPRCSGGLGKARIPKALEEAGEDRLGLGLRKVSSSTISFLLLLRVIPQPTFIPA